MGYDHPDVPTETRASVRDPVATVESLPLPVESFTDEERERLAPHFTNLDRPVFGLVNLPETVKGALFARYSRYPGTLRRLFLDEFADSVPERLHIRRCVRTRLQRQRHRFGPGGAARVGDRE